MRRVVPVDAITERNVVSKLDGSTKRYMTIFVMIISRLSLGSRSAQFPHIFYSDLGKVAEIIHIILKLSCLLLSVPLL